MTGTHTSSPQLTSVAIAWTVQMKQLGITVDFAPVVDVTTEAVLKARQAGADMARCGSPPTKSPSCSIAGCEPSPPASYPRTESTTHCIENPYRRPRQSSH
jgi:hypothetical protein